MDFGFVDGGWVSKTSLHFSLQYQTSLYYTEQVLAIFLSYTNWQIFTKFTEPCPIPTKIYLQICGERQLRIFVNIMRNICYSGMWARQRHSIIIHVFSCCQSFDQTCHVLVPPLQLVGWKREINSTLDISHFVNAMKEDAVCSLLFIFQHE